ncbi:tyrosine-type recombinase/integrase [Enterocloster bolteae]|jgi:site-specific recombinase XerD|uniref:tyrosine-type recombinase/integrase n=1 Tax=Enterocloster bolteae TaxID=208479 RepID=UPI002A810FCC|nr:tyrosine-type recombinase/integrase [Enterocloster bolteae]
MTLKNAFDEFMFQKELAGLSPASLSDYRNYITIMLNHVGESMDLESVTYELVAGYIMVLLHRPLSKATISTYVRNARIFLRWVHAEYGLSFDPVKIKVPKPPKKNVHVLSSAEIQYLLDSVKCSVPWLTARNKAIIALMLDSGLRQNEVCILVKKGLDFDRSALQVTGKGCKDRLVPLGYISKMLLEDYLSQCPYKDVDYVFCGRMGNQISRNAIKVFMNRLKHQIPFDISSHKLRHNFATNFCIDNYRRTGNTGVYDLSILMGHESIETTKRYEHFAHEIIAVENCNSHLDNIYLK